MNRIPSARTDLPYKLQMINFQLKIILLAGISPSIAKNNTYQNFFA